MALLFCVSLVSGLLLGTSFKAFVLIPTSCLAAAVTFAFALTQGSSFAASVAFAMLGPTLVQAGYVVAIVGRIQVTASHKLHSRGL